MMAYHSPTIQPRTRDVGKPKAVIAAERINSRVAGAKVTPHHCRIQEKPDEWYQQFTVIILGLDSLEARQYMNSVVCSFLGESNQSGAVQGKPIWPNICCRLVGILSRSKPLEAYAHP